MKNVFKIVVIVILLQSCRAVDLRTETVMNNPNLKEQKGKELLEQSFFKMGYDQLAKTEVYQVNIKFKWKGIWLAMPMNTFPGSNKKDIQFRFVTNTFDGQLKYLEGRKKDLVVGLQSWQGYKIKPNEELKEKAHARYDWGLATYHYLLESPLRLLSADIIRYAGERHRNGINYDLVYVTWGTEAPNKNYDRWLVYINKETGFIDLSEITINDFFLPMPKGMQHATVVWEREINNEIGAYLPVLGTIQLKSPKNEDSFVYKFSLSNYEFDNFEKSSLYPFKDLKMYGTSKKEGAKNY